MLAVLFIPVAGMGFGPFVAVTVILGFVLFAVQPFEHAAISTYTPPDSRGLSFGFMALGVFGIGAIGATVTGAILSFGSIPMLFLALAVVASVGALVATRLRGYRPHGSSNETVD